MKLRCVAPTARFLRLRGYEVLEAARPEEAIALWQQHGSRIDLLFTDMVMPGELSGMQLARQFLAEKRHLRIIITSGYARGADNLGYSSEIRFLAKPCGTSELLAAVQESLKRQEG